MEVTSVPGITLARGYEVDLVKSMQCDKFISLQITHQFTRTRKDFGRQTRFVSENAQVGLCISCIRSVLYANHVTCKCRDKHARSACMQMLADLRPNEERAKMFVLTVPKTTGVQAGPVMSEHQVRELRGSFLRPDTAPAS